MERTYRRIMCPPGLVPFRVAVGESDLWVAAAADLSDMVKRRVAFYRRQLRTYFTRDAEFAGALLPRPPLAGAPPLVAWMAAAGEAAGVGPMAAVAGAIARAVGEDLLPYSPEVIVENGGDIFLRSTKPRTVAVLAGGSRFSGRLGLAVPPCPGGIGVCTSAGSVGPSLSLGCADAALVVAPDAALADAVATALGNRIGSAEHLQAAVSWAAGLPGVTGALAILGASLAAAGGLTLVPLDPGDLASGRVEKPGS